MLRGELRHDELRERPWARYGKIEVIEHIPDVVAKMSGRDVGDVQPGTRAAGRHGRVIALVVVGKFGKPAVKAVADSVLGLACQYRDQAGIEAAGNIGADRHVTAQM